MKSTVLVTACLLATIQTSHADNNNHGVLKFTGLSKPLPLYPGEVSNRWHHLDIPQGPIAISEFSADIVEKASDGRLVEVPLRDAYLHHFMVFSGQDHTTNIGFGAGTESRGTRQVFPYPYRFVTDSTEDHLVANVHVINTRTMTRDKAHRCVECPCTQQDYAKEQVSSNSNNKPHWWSRSNNNVNNKETNDLENRDITAPEKLSFQVLERRRRWDQCNAPLRNQSNTACSPDTYHGGLLCCWHGEFCLDEYFLDQSDIAHTPDPKTHMRQANPAINETQSVFYFRYAITYQPLTRFNATTVQPLAMAACCDVTGNLTHRGMIEYDIPKFCDDSTTTPTTTTTCVHTLETIQELHGTSLIQEHKPNPTTTTTPTHWVDVVYMVGHLQRGGIEITVYFAENKTVLCQSKPRYGTGAEHEIGNEPGYINAMSTCTFDPPRRMKTTDKLRVVAKYNASQAHTGVMGMFYVAIAETTNNNNKDTTTTLLPPRRSFFERFQRFAATCAFFIVAIAAAHVYKVQHTRRQGYEQIQNLVV